MTEHDRPNFARGLLWLGEAFNEAVSEIRCAAYFDALRDLSWAQLSPAVRQAVAVLRFFPKPIDLRELAMGRVEDDADVAWGLVVAEARRTGAYAVPQLPEPLLLTIRAVFGDWPSFCACEIRGPEGIGWRKQFLQTFGIYARRERDAARALTHGESVDALRRLQAHRIAERDR